MNAKENSTAPAKNTSTPNAKLYGKIVLTLQNCLLPEEKFNSTPSHLDGLDAETETDLRILGCELIQIAGILLKLPQVGFYVQCRYSEFHPNLIFITSMYLIEIVNCTQVNHLFTCIFVLFIINMFCFVILYM